MGQGNIVSTLTSALAFSAAAQAAQPPAIPTEAEIQASEKVCIVVLNRDKDVVTASVADRMTRDAVFLAHVMTKTETGVEGEAMNMATKQSAGLLKVAVTPVNLDHNEISRRPVNCTVDGATYPVKLPDNIEKRLFSPKPTS